MIWTAYIVTVSFILPFLSTVADVDLDFSFDLFGRSLAHSGTISFCFFDFAGLRARRPPSPSDSLPDLALGSGDRSIGDATGQELIHL